MMKEDREPKHRILDAATSLFAQKGYAGVGVREIASEAGVNLAMISYYYEGKVGILKAITEEFFNRFTEVIGDVDDENKSPEECARILVRNIVDFVRENTDLTMVTYNELPLDVPEIAEMKAERLISIVQKVSGLIRRFGLDPEDIFQIGMIGPSLMAMIIMNFRVRPVLKHVLNVDFDEKYYEQFVETIATLFLAGINGLVAKKNEQAGEEKP